MSRPTRSEYVAHAGLRHGMTEQAQSYAMGLSEYWSRQTDPQAGEYRAQIEARVRSIANTLIHYGPPA